MHYRRVRVPGATYAFTVVTYQRRPILTSPTAVTAFLAAVESVRARHPFEVDAYVILPDHLHTMWSLPEDDADYPKRWRLIKSAFTRAMSSELTAPVRSKSRIGKNEQAVWQRRYWEHLIRHDADYNAHLDYIHANPVRHKLADTPAEWPHSTFSSWVERGVYEPDWTMDFELENGMAEWD